MAARHPVLRAYLPPVRPHPQLKIRGRYYPLLRVLLVALAIGVALLGAFIAASFAFHDSSIGQSYLDRFPCVTPSAAVEPGYPFYTRAAHFLNFIYLLFLVRSGIQIMTDHPRLYTSMHCTPGTDWLRLRGDVPRDRTWTAKEDSVSAPSWLGLPGGRHMIGIARHWHFMFDILWIVTGAAFISLQFADGTWNRLVPTNVDLLPGALSCAVTYGHLHDPAKVAGIDAFQRFNALQQLTYFSVIFILPPLQILTGIAMSPAFDNEHKWYLRLFGNRQIARSLHVLRRPHRARAFDRGSAQPQRHRARRQRDGGDGRAADTPRRAVRGRADAVGGVVFLALPARPSAIHGGDREPAHQHGVSRAALG